MRRRFNHPHHLASVQEAESCLLSVGTGGKIASEQEVRSCVRGGATAVLSAVFSSETLVLHLSSAIFLGFCCSGGRWVWCGLLRRCCGADPTQVCPSLRFVVVAASFGLLFLFLGV